MRKALPVRLVWCWRTWRMTRPPLTSRLGARFSQEVQCRSVFQALNSDCGYRFAGCIATVVPWGSARASKVGVGGLPASVDSRRTIPTRLVLLVGSIVLNQNGSLPPVAARQLLQESQ